MLEVSNLSYTYPGGARPAISNIDFSIKSGEIFGFLGPSGAGKSTTQKILIGLLKDYSGNVTYKGTEIKDLTKDYYEEIGVSFELPNHFLKLTGYENLQYFSALYEKSIDHPHLMDILNSVGLEDAADMRVGEYSKGMKNRLNFSRSLIHDPQFLYLDEPTAGLDPVNRMKIIEIIRSKQKEGKTIFLTTHDMETANELCDRVAFIVDGKISVIDAPKTLKLKHGKKTVIVEYGNGVLNSQEFDIEGLADNSEFLELLRNNNVQTIHSQEASLASVFIEVTGRSLS